MTEHWQPCDEGRRLYEAYIEAAQNAVYVEEIDDTLWVWETHRDSCERCKIGAKDESND
jgi:hypothetical protein